MPRPTYNQQVALVDFLEKNPSVMKGRLLSSSGKAENRKKWIKAAIHLNALGGAVKNGLGWAKYWTERKCSLKKLCAARQKATTCSNNGSPQKLSPLSELDLRIINVLGEESFALEDTTYPVDPIQNTHPFENISETNGEAITSTSSSVHLLKTEPSSAQALLSLSRSIEKMAASQEAMAKASESMSNACTLLATAILNFSKNLP